MNTSTALKASGIELTLRNVCAENFMSKILSLKNMKIDIFMGYFEIIKKKTPT